MTTSSDSAPLVLCCSDGSTDAAHAIALGLGLLPAGQFRPLFVTAVPPMTAAIVGGMDPGLAIGAFSDVNLVEVDQANREKAAEQLRALAADVGLDQAEVRVVDGSPAHTIRDLAEDEGANLIIVGQQGLGALDRLILGSVSDYLVRKAPCPVIVVPASADTHASGPVILATDDSTHAHRAAHLASGLLADNVPLMVATVSSRAEPTGADGLSELRARSEQGAAAEIDAHLAMDLNGRTASSVVLHGQPAQALNEYAAAQSARAIVIGTHGRSGFMRAVLGSVAHDVLASAPCPVFVSGPRS